MNGEKPCVLRELYLRYRRWVRRIAQRQFGISSADADDVVQVVFVIASRVLETQQVNAEKAWLLAITRRVCANERRRHRTRKDFEAQYLEATRLFGWSTPAPNSETRFALQGLTRRQREIIELVFIEDLGVHGTASRLGVPPRVVSCGWESAKNSLRRQLDG